MRSHVTGFQDHDQFMEILFLFYRSCDYISLFSCQKLIDFFLPLQQGHTQVNFTSALLQVTMSNQLDLPVRQAGTHTYRYTSFCSEDPPPPPLKSTERDCFISSIYHLWPSSKWSSTADVLSVCVIIYLYTWWLIHMALCVVETLLRRHTFLYSALYYLFSVLDGS